MYVGCCCCCGSVDIVAFVVIVVVIIFDVAVVIVVVVVRCRQRVSILNASSPPSPNPPPLLYRFFPIEGVEPLLSIIFPECLEGEGRGFILAGHVEAPSLLDRVRRTTSAIRHHERLRCDTARLACRGREMEVGVEK